MDLRRIVAELRLERDQVSQAIRSLERVVISRKGGADPQNGSLKASNVVTSPEGRTQAGEPRHHSLLKHRRRRIDDSDARRLLQE